MHKKNRLTVRQFYDLGRDTLQLRCASAEDFLDRIIPEPAINRPGLAFAGFSKYFANNRLQVLGMAEQAYLKHLSATKRAETLKDFFASGIPGVILARNRQVPSEMRDLSHKYKVPILRSALITRQFIHLGTMMLDRLTAPRIKLRGTMVDIQGIGALIQGKPFIGKSETALGLIEMGHSLVSDDVTIIRKDSWGGLMGSAVELTRFHMEIRGIGIIHVPSLYGVTSVRGEKQLDVIIILYRPGTEEEELDAGDYGEKQNIMGVEVPLLRIPVRAGRDIAHLVQVAALNQKLRQLGHDATKELDQRVVDELTKKRGSSD